MAVHKVHRGGNWELTGGSPSTLLLFAKNEFGPKDSLPKGAESLGFAGFRLAVLQQLEGLFALGAQPHEEVEAAAGPGQLPHAGAA